MSLDYSGDALPAYFDTDDLGPESYDLTFDWVRPPLTANDRMHWSQKARKTAMVREATSWKARQLRIPSLPRVRVSLAWIVTDRRRRDGGENIAPTLKPMIDGLVDAGIVPDDTPDLVVRDMPTIRYVEDASAHLLLRVSRILAVSA